MCIKIENELFCLCLNEACVAESLVLKATGEECLAQSECMPLFSLTEDRPYNNEIKLAYPNKRTVFQANRVRREGNKLIVGFELITFEAVVEIKEAKDYVAFTLCDFIIKPEDFEGLSMTPPPVAEFRLIQLPVIRKERFGQWLNVSWDETLAVCVLGTSAHPRIDAEKNKNCRILTADAVRGIKMKGCSAALVVSEPKTFLDKIEQIEADYNLPKGVANRRKESINRSIYWSEDVTPQNVDEHIAYAKKMGFTMMLIYQPAIYRFAANIYSLWGEHKFREEYPNGLEDVKKMLSKIKSAGITPGLHILHTHIGIDSHYVTPVADHRLNLTKHFTLAKPLGTDGTTVFVEENPEDTVMHEKCRVLKFGGELIYYENYTTEYPYRFLNCKRGHYGTFVTPHEMGTIGGVLDISEYTATSVYLNQNSSLQDEIADDLSALYNCGFAFVYFDGSEGTNPPFEFHIPNAQYRVYRKLKQEPLFCEGAAKAHFSWHMLSGGNAFDVFPMDVFKAKIAEFPMEEAPRMINDFTRLNFGWWGFFDDTQPDHYEYGSSRAAAWDCPVTVMENRSLFRTTPRAEDMFEVLRRWEDVRAKHWLTEEQKKMLKQGDQEHILLINEAGEYELLPYDNVSDAEESLSAFIFERNGKNCAVIWHKTGEGKAEIPLSETEFVYVDEIGGAQVLTEKKEGITVIPVGKRRYILSEIGREELISVIRQIKML